ncbi:MULTISPECIES: Fe-S-containing hydro-lyase [Cytobacillus]|uniref:Fe-S-containing hydro-lyase n=1 Tax=Cytobacillus TaxID=2675230 RepID=UPI00204003A8|nr:Fe-S-containing hydro-lyase [Cytobacillus kochii]MCM3321481.1 Fe-S-containing hydro-lyase [Cytobacillus kochii]MCM3343685.1 Fe-S-containing hydro-lyase [Cytobacillus kochii]MDM5207516.1 Fe-S-containing hydro-lyase [Cytobacillus kochii]
MEKKQLSLPLKPEELETLRAGQQVELTGLIYTARDAAHKKIYDLLSQQETVPFTLENAFIYYVGPTPAKPNQVIGSAGPTTSSRMDKYTPLLLEHGLKGMIGKGYRNEEVKESIKRNKAVYLAAIGGTGALLSTAIREAEVVAFPELGPEAVYRLTVEHFPATVIIDSLGNDWYIQAREKFQQERSTL